MKLVRFGMAVIGVAAMALAAPANAQPRVLNAVGGITNAPWSFKVGDGPQQGMVVELCNAIAADNGWTIQYQAIAFAEFFNTIAAGNGDILCSVFSYTEERAQRAAFTPPFFEAQDGLAVLASDATQYETWQDLRNLPVGVPRATLFESTAVQSGIFTDLRIYDTNQAGLDAVASGEIKAFISLEPSLLYIAGQSYPTVRVLGWDEPNVRIPYNFMVRKDDPELLAAVNASMAKLWSNGTAREIMSRWGF